MKLGRKICFEKISADTPAEKYPDKSLGNIGSTMEFQMNGLTSEIIEKAINELIRAADLRHGIYRTVPLFGLLTRKPDKLRAKTSVGNSAGALSLSCLCLSRMSARMRLDLHVSSQQNTGFRQCEQLPLPDGTGS